MAIDVFPYQHEGATWMVGRERGGLHDEMGVGKTATTIRAVDMIDAERGVLVVPAMLRENWLQEFRKFSVKPRRICKGMNIHDFYAWQRGRFHILITSYELAVKWAEKIRTSGEVLDFWGFDEAHYLKNGGAARTRILLGPEFDAVDGACEWAQRVWHITGTPMANDPVDIYTFLRLCGVMPLSKDKFIKRYFHMVKTRFGSRQEPLPEMIGELKALIENNSIRRTQAQVGLQLPPIFLTETYVDGDTEQVIAMLRDHPGLEAEIVRALEEGGLSFIDSQHISTLRRLIAEAKSIPYAHILLDELQSGATAKRVVFGNSKDALYNIRNFLWKNRVRAVLVTGDTSERERIEAVRAFQEDEDCAVFIGNTRAAGVGINLFASCEIDIFEGDWTPAGNAQAIKRVHRIGQTRNVRARFITLARTIDEVVNRIVARKTAAIASIEGDAMNAAPLELLAEFI